MEKLEIGKPLWERTQNPREAADIIARAMMHTRPRGEICYRPYRVCKGIGQKDILGAVHIDLKEIYPEAREGDVVYIGTVLESVADYEISLVVSGDVKVFYGGAEVYDARRTNTFDWGVVNIAVKQGENDVLFLCRHTTHDFKMSFVPSVRHYPGMWAKDYLLHVRACSPISAFCHEDGVGISRLYQDGEAFDGAYIYPEPPTASEEIRFDKIFPEAIGECCYALTYCLEDTLLEYRMLSPGKVLVNGEERKTAEGTIGLCKGDEVLVKSVRSSEWGFTFCASSCIGIPFLQSGRPCGDQWLTIGAFGGADSLDMPMGPELQLQFDRPYCTDDWTQVYWQMNRYDDVIRPYLDTCFFGQWFYALMVGGYGLLQAAHVLKRVEYQQYFIDSMQYMAQYFTYVNYEADRFGDPTFLARATKLIDLDSIGSMGMNLAELYRLTGNPEAMHCIDALKDAMFSNVPRFADGTFYRGETMWADDVFMSCPFLVRLGKITGNSFYFEECIRQIMGFQKRLWREQKYLFSHIYFVTLQTPNEISWGRGNGWIFLSLSELLELLPPDTKGYDDCMHLFQKFAQGVLAQQDKSGLWHQVLDMPESYLETSCTGMFMIGMCKGMRNGWLPRQEYEAAVKKAYRGLLQNAVDDEGNIYGVCKGSGCSMDPQYYMDLDAVTNDDHGTGILLYALSELILCGN